MILLSYTSCNPVQSRRYCSTVAGIRTQDAEDRACASSASDLRVQSCAASIRGRKSFDAHRFDNRN